MNGLRRRALGLLACCAAASPVMAQRAPGQADSARDCAVCHLSWVDTFQRRPQEALIERPSDAIVSHEDTCLGCHDGSVGDSRRKVWLQHGHLTGVKPSAAVQVPDALPLTKGALDCRTCHSAHSGEGPETLANTVFIRVPNESSQLCQMCHSGYAEGPARGRHPLGHASTPVPETLLAAGAHAGSTPKQMTCQSCHAAHGSREDQLLVASLERGALCLACHEEMRPGMFLSDPHRVAKRNPPLAMHARVQAIRDMGTRAGAGDVLICSSCHKMHDSVGGRFLLADSLESARLCLRCHADYAGVLDSTHNLVRSAPDERNRFGQIPAESGACLACHGFHRFARELTPEPTDVTGQCATCHREGECAGAASGLPLGHPVSIEARLLDEARGLRLYPSDLGTRKSLACVTCHDPHRTQHGNYLRAAPDDLCAACHADDARMLSGVHDLRSRPDLRNARGLSASRSGACGSCHAVHGTTAPALWAATPNPPKDAAGLCMECHRPDGIASRAPVPELRHPTEPCTALDSAAGCANLPLFDAQGRRASQGAVACATCHDPHASAGSPAMLRDVGSGSPAALCMECHRNAQPIHDGMHSPSRLGPCAAGAGDSPITECRACHRSHADAGMGPQGMWSGPEAAASWPQDIGQCMGCHAAGGCATAVTFRNHPAVSLRNVVPATSPGYLPLAPDPANPQAEGRITCTTCHLPHGRFDASGRELAVPLSEPEFRASRPMLRPYLAPNLCSSCHGFDGLLRFLYYHASDSARGPSRAF